MGFDKLTLISATPSPFARMNRIALREKGIEFDLVNEVPWNKGTQTPEYNPLEQLPILIFPTADNKDPVYGSAHIQDYITQIWSDQSPKLETDSLQDNFKIKQITILAVGVMDASVLLFWENERDEQHQSQSWKDRQQRKINGGMKAFQGLVKGKGEFVVGGVFSNADIAIACAVTHVEFLQMHVGWQKEYPELKEWYDRMEQRQSFQDTRPKKFELEKNIV